MWGPYLVEPRDRVASWSQYTLSVLRTLAAQDGTGVRLVSGVEASRVAIDPPDWGEQLDGFEECHADELPSGFVTGWRYRVPLVDMPTYLDYLQQRLDAVGVRVENRRIDSLAAATASAPVVVNCTGTGARDLVPDPDLKAVRGQLVVLANPGITEFFSEDTGSSIDLLHVYPYRDTVVLGGQAVPDDWNMRPDLDVAASIVARCAEVDPRLLGAPILGHRVGLRPTRPEIRVEAQPVPGAMLIHNYGHGGAGVTLSWGCAMEVARLVRNG